MSACLVIGVGNRDRGDDGAGLEVARRLKRRAPGAVRVIECPDAGYELIELWRDAARVVLVDAAQGGAEPGAVRRFEARRAALPAGLARSSHGHGAADAVELARSLDALPSELVVYAIEASGFAHGAALSPPVRRAVGRVAERILRELAERPGARARRRPRQ